MWDIRSPNECKILPTTYMPYIENISLKLPKCGHVFQINGLKDPKEVTCIPLNILFDPEAALTRLRLTEEQSSGSETKIRLNQLRGRLIPNTAQLQHPITSNILTGLLLQGISFNFERYRCMCDLFTVYSCFMDQGVARALHPSIPTRGRQLRERAKFWQKEGRLCEFYTDMGEGVLKFVNGPPQDNNPYL